MEPIKISSEYHLIRNELRSPVGKEALTKQMNLPTSLFAESILLAQQDPPFRLGVRYSLARCIWIPTEKKKGNEGQGKRRVLAVICEHVKHCIQWRLGRTWSK